MSGIYQRQVNSGSVASPSAGRTLISVNETGELFTKDSSGNVIVYPTSSNGGSGSGSPFPFTGSADISGTLNVDYSDAFTFNVGNTVSQSYLEYLDGIGWTELQFTGSNIGSKLDFNNNEIYNAIQVGNSSIPGFGSLPVAQASRILNVNDGIISGSSLSNGFIVTDQTGIDGDVVIQNVMFNAINNTVSGSKVSYKVGTEIEQNSETSTFDFGKRNEAGETIGLNFNSEFPGLSLFSGITDEDAIIFRIVDFAADGVTNLLEIKKGGPDVVTGQNGFEIIQPSSSFTASLFGVYDSDDNILFSVTSGSTTFDSTLPTSAAGLSAGQVYTQTAAELGGSGATKVLCIV